MGKGFTTRSRLKLALMAVLVVSMHADFTAAMQVTSTGPQTIQRAVGETVTLGCTYTPDATDTGELDIEWSNVRPDMTQKDQLLLSYAGGQTLKYGDPGLSQRLNFIGDPTMGDASVTISGIKVSDTATYQCKVKKSPGVDMRKVTLVVMVPPSVPKCWVDGNTEKGSPVTLRCNSKHGSIPLSYVWIRESGGAIPTDVVQNPQSGELQIKNLSDSYIGNYLCEAKNSVGKEHCKYTLKAYEPTNKVGVIVGSVIGALLLLLLLLLLIWLLVCCCHKRRYEKEVANEIREDVHAPESRPNSRNSSFRSVMGYRAHQGMVYSSVRAAKPQRTDSTTPSTIYKDPSLLTANTNSNGQHAPALPPPLKYDSRYGYPV